MSKLSPAERIERAKHAAHTRWSRLSTTQRLAATAPGLRAMLEYYERQVDPDGALSEKERAKLAKNARQAQLAQARRKALKATRERGAQ
ncbi:MAG: hypothetical protein ACLQIK_00145 [Mycobacterium sp.]|uniref:hypothetical protein n=1 Tax=Mycobacterium sp. TaxID=1785 RepID=UPI003F99C26B